MHLSLEPGERFVGERPAGAPPRPPPPS
eukprot:SAG31_NODE_3579_length_4102_cov_3.565326_1_plen_27_part_10